MGSTDGQNTFVSDNYIGIEFLGSVPQHHLCFVCRDVLREAKQTHPCGHRFCSSCLDNGRREERSCPKCHQEIKQMWLDIGKVREIMELPVKCSNNKTGCMWNGKLDELENGHKQNCQYEMFNCTNYSCEKTFYLKDLESHVINDCCYRLVDCERCEYKYQNVYQQSHQDLCLQFPLECDNKCGKYSIARKDMAKHIKDECERTIHSCEYQLLHCDFQGTRSDLLKHTDEAKNHHFYLTLNSKANGRVDTAFQEINLLQSMLKNGEEQLRNRITTLTTAHFSEQNIEATSRADEIEDAIGNYLEFFQQSLEELNLRSNNKTNAIETQLESYKYETKQQTKTICSKIFQHENDLVKQSCEIQELKENTQHFPGEMDKLFSEITVLEPQCNMLPNRSLVFVIEDFQENFRKSKENEHRLIYSDPFYCLRGYKALVCMFMNGWGDGINNHISCYFEVLKGPFDDALDWPLQMEIDFIIKGKDGNDFQLGFDSNDIPCDDLERHFGKPKDVANIVWGFSCFLDHVDVNRYVSDDTMKIYIGISPSTKQKTKNLCMKLDAIQFIS